MASNKGLKLPWGSDVDDAHYRDALDYLSLKWTPERAEPIVDLLRDADLQKAAPGNVLRAADKEPLGLEDLGVIQEIRKALNSGEMTPILCVNLPDGVVIADGYHRTSAAYRLSPFHKMPMKLVDDPYAFAEHDDD